MACANRRKRKWAKIEYIKTELIFDEIISIDWTKLSYNSMKTYFIQNARDVIHFEYNFLYFRKMKYEWMDRDRAQHHLLSALLSPKPKSTWIKISRHSECSHLSISIESAQWDVCRMWLVSANNIVHGSDISAATWHKPNWIASSISLCSTLLIIRFIQFSLIQFRSDHFAFAFAYI